MDEAHLSEVPEHLREQAAPFIKAALDASYHFADDSGSEWGRGKERQAECQRIFNEGSDELRAALRRISRHYLISLREPSV